MMVWASSLHKQYLGTSKGRGLSQAFELLERKGLFSVKGPFHHNLNEALHHVAEAHIREDWLLVSVVDSLAELRDKGPNELVALAARIVKERASSEALDRRDMKPVNQHDEVNRQTVMWNMDVLQYIVVYRAIKHGQVGLMEDILPHLLFRFVGNKNSKYSIEVLELLQSLHREWPEEVK